MNYHVWLTALAGGLLIGSAASLLFGLNGRLAGISGILGGIFSRDATERHWRIIFLAGLAFGAATWYAIGGSAPQARTHFPPALLIVAGLLVGYGTSLAKGCTSGHGVCGLGRLSPRSLIATTTFLASGIAATFVVRHLLGVQS